MFNEIIGSEVKTGAHKNGKKQENIRFKIINIYCRIEVNMLVNKY